MIVITAKIRVELDIIRFKDKVDEWLLGFIVSDKESVRSTRERHVIQAFGAFRPEFHPLPVVDFVNGALDVLSSEHNC